MLSWGARNILPGALIVEKDFRNIFKDAQVYQDDAVGFREIEPDIDDGAESARRIGFVVEML